MSTLLDGISQILAAYIKFPYNVGEKANIKVQFAAWTNFSNLVRHVAIKATSQDEFDYVKGKRFHSVNVKNQVQCVCRVQIELTNPVARWPKTQDSFIVINMVGNRLLARMVKDGGILVKKK